MSRTLLWLIHRTNKLKHVLVYILISSLFISILSYYVSYTLENYDIWESILKPPKQPSENYLLLAPRSASPLTTVFDEEIVTSKLTGINNVTIIRELLYTVYINGESFILRGLYSRDLVYYIDQELKDFENCIMCVWVGKHVANKLGVKVNNTLTLYSPFTNTYYRLKIKDLLDTGTFLDYELLTNIYTARMIRGSGFRAVSVVIIYGDQYSLHLVLDRFNISYTEKSLLHRVLLVIQARRNIRFKQVEALSDIYLSRLGLNKAVLYTLLLSMSILFSVGVVIYPSWIMYSNRNVYKLLYEVGVSLTKIKYSLAIYYGLLSLITASVLLLVYSRISFRYVLYMHELMLSLNSLIVASIGFGIYGLFIIGLLLAKLE